MNEFALIGMFLSFLIIVLYELYVRSASIVLWAGLFVLFAIPHAFDVILHVSNFRQDTYFFATIFVLVFNVVYISSRIVLHPITLHRPKWLDVSSSNKTARNYINLLFISLIISTALFLVHIYISFGSFTQFTWIDLFDNRQTVYYAISSYLLSLSAPLAYIATIRRQYRLALTALGLLVITLVLSRVRANAIAIFVPLIVWYLYSGQSFGKTMRRLIYASLFGITFIATVLGFGALRVFGDYSESINFLDLLQVTFDLISSPHSEFGLRNAFYYFVENDNNFEGFGYGLGYVRLLLMPIPYSLSFDLKPIDFASYMSVAYDPENSMLGVNSMHPTLYGDLFANFYYFAPLVAPLWAALIKLLDSLWLRQKENIFAASIFVSIAYALTLVARGALYNGLYNVFFLFAVNWMLSLIFARTSKF